MKKDVYVVVGQYNPELNSSVLNELIDCLKPFYPINDERNSALYAQYKQLADQESRVIFGGRLAEYKYYDMAPIIEKVMGLFRS